MRYFNTLGPVNEQDQAVIPRTALVDSLVARIAEGQFFPIFAARQMGKTTLLRRLREILRQQAAYLLELETTQSHCRKNIHVYLVRLGHVFDDAASDK